MTDRKYTVETLLLEVDRVLLRHWPMVAVEGEVQQIQSPASGHAYLVLREKDAQLPVVVWKNDWKASTYKPGVGERVIARGRFGLYAGQGRYQLYANVIRPAGEGALARELAARRDRMERDGLLDPRRKRPLPRFPAVVGLATSASGAALQDFLRVSRERWPAAKILVAACQVQGPEAPSSVIRALELLCEDGRADVIVVTRGGGSKSDLMAFNDELLARWVATCPIPIVSAVGHEIDDSLTDLAADAMAPTPSAAAILVLPDGRALTQRVDERLAALERAGERVLVRKRRELVRLRERLRDPHERLVLARKRREDLVARATSAIARTLAGDRLRYERTRSRLRPSCVGVASRTRSVEAAEGRLRALSPLAVLARGYAIVSGPHGVVEDPAAVNPGDRLAIRVRAGVIAARVDEPAGEP